MIINVVLVVVGGLLATASSAAFATLQLLVHLRRLQNRAAFLLLFIPFSAGLAAMMTGSCRNLLSSL